MSGQSLRAGGSGALPSDLMTLSDYPGFSSVDDVVPAASSAKVLGTVVDVSTRVDRADKSCASALVLRSNARPAA